MSLKQTFHRFLIVTFNHKESFEATDPSDLKHYFKNLLSLILHGRAEKLLQGFYLLLVMGFYTANSLLAQSFFPSHYNPLLNHISQQGGWSANPEGFLIWNLGMIILGISLIPHLSYIYHAFKDASPNMAKVAFGFSLLASINVSLVGIFPEDLLLPHQIVSSLAFVGFIVSIYCYLYAIISQRVENSIKWPNWFIIAFIYALIFVGLVGVCSYQFVGDMILDWGWDPRFTQFPPWEWLLFISILVWMTGIFLVIPSKH